MKVILVVRVKVNEFVEQTDKVSVFYLLKNNGEVYVAMIANAKTKILMRIIREKVQ